MFFQDRSYPNHSLLPSPNGFVHALNTFVMTPCRTEKVNFSKKTKNKNKNINRITKKNKSTGRITRRNKKTINKKKKLHFPQFLIVCFLFFPWFWFSSLFFFVCSGFVINLYFILFFCQTLYSLCCWTHNTFAGVTTVRISAQKPRHESQEVQACDLFLHVHIKHLLAGLPELPWPNEFQLWKGMRW
jgi:hypothetical protein